MQKDIREEMERLKTQYTFKVGHCITNLCFILTQIPQQHEMETAIRKPPWSVRSRRTATEAPPTPVAVPAQMRNWNAQPDSRAAGPSKAVETPRGPRFGTLPKGSPKTVRNHKTTAASAMESAKKSAKLGFYNSFDTSTPVRPSQTKAAKARNGRGIIEDGATDWMGKTPSLFGQPTSGHLNAGVPPPSPPSSPTRGGRAVSDVDMQSDDHAAFPASDGNVGYDNGDMGMSDVDMGIENAEDESSEELEDIEGPNWKEEVSDPYPMTL